MWNKAIFTFDANILLNFYRYSDDTREEFIKIFDKIKDRVWIPHQSAQEFFDNRLNVISQQEKAYEDAIVALNSIETEFKNSRQHPFIEQKLLNRFSILSKEICEQLNSSKEFHNKRIIEDDILSKIESLFENKVGDEYNPETLGSLFKEGETRFANKIPPGFKDSGKKDDGDKDIRKYGDFIVWKQIMEKSKDSKCDIILITDDRKEDWWVRFKGKTISPRPELIKEFRKFTSQSFHMYQSDRFLEYAREYLGETINEKAIEEIRELRILDELRRLSKIEQKQELMKLKEFRKILLKKKSILERLKYIQEEKKYTENKLNEQYLLLNNSDPSAFNENGLIQHQQQLRILEEDMKSVIHRIRELEEQEDLFIKQYGEQIL